MHSFLSFFFFDYFIKRILQKTLNSGEVFEMNFKQIILQVMSILKDTLKNNTIQIRPFIIFIKLRGIPYKQNLFQFPKTCLHKFTALLLLLF